MMLILRPTSQQVKSVTVTQFSRHSVQLGEHKSRIKVRSTSKIHSATASSSSQSGKSTAKQLVKYICHKTGTRVAQNNSSI